VNDQCCTTGYMCPDGSQCYIDSLGYQVCLTGSTTKSASPGQPAQTSGKSGSTAPTTTKSGSTTPTTTGTASVTQQSSTASHTSGAEAARRAGYGFAALVPLAIPAVLFG
jgi:hypothetical protein